MLDKLERLEIVSRDDDRITAIPPAEALAKLEPFEADPIGATIKSVAQECGVKTGALVHPTRLACCGSTAGPSLYHLMAVLGKMLVLNRIDAALAKINAG
jgi:glutamyl/glutaminyl-tRNA synthetase